MIALSTTAVTAAAQQSTPTAGGACVTDDAKKTLAACSNNGPTQFDVAGRGKAPKVNFHSAPPPADLKKRDQQMKPTNPSEGAPERDQRKNRLASRAKALLVTEIQGLESLFRSTPKNAPDRPTLARRLAEDYVELESAAFREKTQANQADQVMKLARKKAIDNYTLIVTDYPTYGQLDEVLYYLAYEYEQASDLKNARSVYFDLI
ncbi:MAG: hypothetical protein ABIP39_03005, partial [Polyangiaceae bacterium]